MKETHTARLSSRRRGHGLPVSSTKGGHRLAAALIGLCWTSMPAVAQPTTGSAIGPNYDLNGEWQANFHLPEGVVPHRIMIVSLGTEVTATKVTGDKYVPAGKVTMKGNYPSNPFEVQVQCAGLGFRNPQWGAGTVKVIDNDHMTVSTHGGGCLSVLDDWSRVGRPTLALDNAILFDFDKYELKPGAQTTLDKVVTWLNEKHPVAHLLVAGYTDDRGTEGHNLTLSRERAETVAAALKAKGIAVDRLAIKGFGKADPRYPNTNEEARARNRRVEIVIED